MELTYPVKNIDDAYNACNPEQSLGADDPRYVDLNPVRGDKSLAVYVTQRIQRTARDSQLFHKELISGHRGSGKSTELKRLQAHLKAEKFFAIYINIEEILDLGEIKYQDVLITIAQAIGQAMSDADIMVDGRILKQMESWFDEKILTEELKKDTEALLKAEAGIEGKVPFFVKALASFTSQIRSGSSHKTEIRRKIEQELSGFILLVNLYINEARAALIKHGYCDFVVLVDGLEKMLYQKVTDDESTHSELYIQHAAQLKAPQCHLIYTVPISLAFRRSLGNVFPNAPLIVPMVDYKKPEGRECLREVLGKRIDIASIFENPASVDILIEMCGGSVRDLLRLFRYACDYTDTTIKPTDVQKSRNDVINEFDRLIYDEDIPLLVELENTPDKNISFDKYARLLELRLVHEYQNGERWADLHPAVRANRRVIRAIDEAPKGILI